jgi:hypothetical protein
MHRRTRLLLLAAATALVIPTAIDATAASAVDQDLTLTATSGVAGDEVTATSASCDVGESGDEYRFLSAQLITGSGADARLAGVSISDGDFDATFVVPDWVDPADDAVVVGRCISIDFSTEEPTQSIFEYDPISFDVQPGLGLPVQQRTYSRTSLLAGQAFQVDSSGCFLDDAVFSSVEVAQGSDLSFQSAENFVAFGGAETTAGSASIPVAMSNGGISTWISQSSGEPAVIEKLEEIPTDIPAGTYSSISYCQTEQNLSLVFEPQLIEITGDAPYADVDLTVPDQSRTATLAGGSCTAGDVNWELDAYDSEDAFGFGGPIDPDVVRTNAVRADAAPASLSRLRGASSPDHLDRRNDAWARSGSRTGRALADDEFAEGQVTPDGAGAWSASDEAGFDQGYVEGYSWCGDPLADGFLYDPQAAIVSVDPVVPTVPPTVPVTTTPPAAAPADAVSGTPTYAG